MEDFRKEIPQRAFINAQIIQQVMDSSDFQDAIDQVSNNYGLSHYQFMNQAHIVSLLYCLLVIPREVFVSGNENILDQRLPSDSVVTFFDIIHDANNSKLRSSQFIRRLRNSVAHARFTIDSQMNFTFSDRSPRALDDEFIVKASVSSLMAFLSRIGSYLANLRTNQL